MTDKMQEKQSTDWSALIARHPLFEAIDAEERELLLSDKASRKHLLKAGEVILKQNETGYSVFVICEGAVSVTLEGPHGKSIELYTLTDGEIFGEMAILGRRLRTATLVTTEPSKLLEIGGDEFLGLMKKHHEITLYLLATLSRRLRHTDDMILTRRIPEIDSSLAELKTQLDVIAQTTDAKLAATQTVFEQTSTRANEIIDSADRARAQMKWAAGLAGALATVFLGAGFFNFERAQRHIEDVQEKIDDAQEKIEASQTVVEEKEKAVEISAADAELAKVVAEEAAGKADGSASKAEEFVEKAQAAVADLEEISREARANGIEIERLKNEAILTQFLTEIEQTGYTDRTVEYYFSSINADLPELRAKLVEFLHGEIIDSNKYPAILGMLKTSLKKHGGKMSPDAQVATYYFIALIHILENKPTLSARYESYIEEKSGGGRNYFADIFGTESKFDRGLSDFITILTLQENDPVSRQHKQEALEQLYDTLKQST